MPTPWPKNAKVAVTLTFDFDAESGWLSRDPALKDRPGIMSQGWYGAKIGVPRILDLLKKEKLPATFFIPGWVVEKYPTESKRIRDAGYEIGHHGYLHERATPENPEGEREAFEKGMRALDRVLGVKPAGYRAPAWDLTPITLDCVKQHGMMYSSNLMDDVFPYVHPGTSIVELPVQWVLDDAPYFMFNPLVLNRPMNTAEAIYGVWRDEFLAMYEWGGLFNLTCHPEVVGHGSRMLMLRKLIRFMKKQKGVWFTTCHAVAEHWLARSGT
jgi:peptidoglycan/xylan/chitin deacetylase (PgdA/CDA1 family)